MNVDCEIYLKNFVSFFNNNPQDLQNLIGSIQKVSEKNLIENVK